MEIYKQVRDPNYKYSDNLDWQIHLNTNEFMKFVLTNKEVRNSFKEWLDKQQ